MARAFDGVDDVLTVTNAAALEPAQVTVALWFKGTRGGNFLYLLAKSLAAGEHGSYAVETGGATVDVQFDIGYGTGTGAVRNVAYGDGAGSSGIYDGAWHHLAASYDLATMRLYTDGVQRSTLAATDAIAYTAKGLHVGAFIDGYGGHKAGDFADVGVYSVALTADEIAALARGTPPSRVRPSALAHYQPLWGPAADLSGNANSGTLTGTTAVAHAPTAPYAPAPGWEAGSFAPSGGAAQALTPAAAAVTVAAQTPALTGGPAGLTPAAAAVAVTAQQPNATPGVTTAAPTVATLNMAPQAPAQLAGPASLVTPVVDVVLTAQPPTFETGLFLTPAAAALTIVPQVPDLQAGPMVVAAAAADLTIAAQQPATAGAAVLLVDVAGLTLAAQPAALAMPAAVKTRTVDSHEPARTVVSHEPARTAGGS